MFPFIVKGKVPLGPRRDYNLSETGLEERIAERLIKPERRSQVRKDGSPSGDGRGILTEGLSRLRSLGFLTAVRVRKIRIFSRKDFLFARYEMDATASTLVSMVIIPLVLGSILFSHSGFSFYEALTILIILVLGSWGLDVLVLVMMLRHEIYQIASEIRAVLEKYDNLKIDLHHQDLSPEELLSVAYYYERNGLVLRCEAYLVHLSTQHPDSFEASLAREHMETLDGFPSRSAAVRTRDGQKKESTAGGKKPSRIKVALSRLKAGRNTGTRQKSWEREEEDKKEKRWARFRISVLLKNKEPSENSGKKTKGSDKTVQPAARYQKRGLFGLGSRKTLQTRVVRKRQERLARREAFTRAPSEKSLSFFARVKLRLSRIINREGREERKFRREQERWIHGPPPPKRKNNRGRGGHWRPRWMKSSEEKKAADRQNRWLEGFSGPGTIQRSRDRWGRLRLVSGRSRAQKEMMERKMRATEETSYPRQ